MKWVKEEAKKDLKSDPYLGERKGEEMDVALGENKRGRK